MTKIKIRAIKARLEKERERLSREIESVAAELPSYEGSPNDSLYGNDMADEATDIFEDQKALAIQAHLTGILNLVEGALRKIELGTYGRCEECGRQIDPARLETIPYVRLCVECQARSEGRRAA